MSDNSILVEKMVQQGLAMTWLGYLIKVDPRSRGAGELTFTREIAGK